ncbi:MAG: DNA alkylation repair protein [Candidatus Limnocylindrales bacterium]
MTEAAVSDPRAALTSAVTAAAQAFVADHLAQAAALGERLIPLLGRPDEFAAELEAGFRELADPAYIDVSRRITPGLGEIVGVRLPLMEAAHKAFKRGTQHGPSSPLLDVVDRLIGNRYGDIRWFGMWNLERLLPTDPERTWQLMRRAAREAAEWITVDTLAHPYAAGILRDQRRWAELEQLVFSPSRWERRLVGSTLATMPHVNVPGGQDPLFMVRRGLALISQLIGDSEPDVQKALSWALRTYAQLNPPEVTVFLEAEAQAARRDQDGNRAWVIRDSLSKLPDDTATYLRASLDGIRRAPGAPSTSRAAIIAADFASSTGRNSAP